MSDKPKIMVIGDIILDHYLIGEVTRISPEAPVPVVNLRKETWGLGGAANVANNLVSFGFDPILIGYTNAHDTEINHLHRLLRASNIQDRHLVNIYGRPISKKTRVMAGQQQLVRVDDEPMASWPVDKTYIEWLIEEIELNMSCCHVCIISDYNKGVINRTGTVARAISKAADTHGVSVIVDPCPSHCYGRIDSLVPNEKEAHEMLEEPEFAASDIQTLMTNLSFLRNDADYIVVTRGKNGAAFKSNDTEEHNTNDYGEALTGEEVAVVDVCGAGDTFMAAYGAKLHHIIEEHGRVPLEERIDAIEVAVSTATSVVRKPGVVVAEPDYL